MSLLIYAPNVHEGGGLSILRALLRVKPSNLNIRAILDIRCKDLIQKEINDDSFVILWVQPKFHHRLYCEYFLKKNHKIYSQVLCLHNIPPILCKPKKLTIFFQNKLLIDKILFKNNLKNAILILFQKIIIILFSNNQTQYMVQSQGVKNGLMRMLNKFRPLLPLNTKINVLPFADISDYINNTSAINSKKWDFIFPASLYTHKNHVKLIEAWCLLKREGISPSLALTISQESIHGSILDELIQDMELDITLLGSLLPTKMREAYLESSALIYPSKVESLGLPLIEASALNLPIIASDLDYVFESCSPNQTFNPESATSISMAIKRHMAISNFVSNIKSPREFWNQVIR